MCKILGDVSRDLCARRQAWDAVGVRVTAMWHFRIAFRHPSDRTSVVVRGFDRPAGRARTLVHIVVAYLLAVAVLGAIVMGFIFVGLVFLALLIGATAVLVFRRVFSRRQSRLPSDIVITPLQESSRSQRQPRR